MERDRGKDVQFVNPEVLYMQCLQQDNNLVITIIIIIIIIIIN